MPKSTRKEKPDNPPGQVRFVRSITLRNGRVIFAEDYGHKAFPIPVRSGALRRALKRPKR